MSDGIKIVCSWGAGVQSTAIALLVEQGRLPRPDLWLFADTGDEPRAIYSHVRRWRPRLEALGEFRVVRSSRGRLSDHVLSKVRKGEGGISMPPMYVDRLKRSGRMPIRRGCTRDFKVRTMDREIRAWANVPRGYKGKPIVRHWLGISTDEAQRAKSSQVAWRRFEYPLLCIGLSRTDCVGILQEAEENAVKSACVFCPFHSNAEWRKIRSNAEDWAAAVAFEREVHRAWDTHGSVAGLKSRPTLHPSGLPLDDAPIGSPEDDPWQDFDNECAGVCGV